MPGIDKLSINLATVRERWGLREAVEGCARLGWLKPAPSASTSAAARAALIPNRMRCSP